MTDWTQKHVMITGAAHGIGRALALRLADRARRLWLIDRDAEALSALQRGWSGSAEVHVETVDLACTAELNALAHRVATATAAPQILVNNAGVASNGDFLSVLADDWDWVWAVNFHAPMALTRALAPRLQQSPGGHLVNVSSINALLPFPTNSPYNASKAALRAWSDTLWQEWQDTPAAVTCAIPGGVRTGIVARSRPPAPGRAANFEKVARLTPDYVARRIVRAVERNRREVLIGPDARLLSLLNQWFPERTRCWLQRWF